MTLMGTPRLWALTSSLSKAPIGHEPEANVNAASDRFITNSIENRRAAVLIGVVTQRFARVLLRFHGACECHEAHEEHENEFFHLKKDFGH